MVLGIFVLSWGNIKLSVLLLTALIGRFFMIFVIMISRISTLKINEVII